MNEPAQSQVAQPDPTVQLPQNQGAQTVDPVVSSAQDISTDPVADSAAVADVAAVADLLEEQIGIVSPSGTDPVIVAPTDEPVVAPVVPPEIDPSVSAPSTAADGVQIAETPLIQEDPSIAPISIEEVPVIEPAADSIASVSPDPSVPDPSVVPDSSAVDPVVTIPASGSGDFLAVLVEKGTVDSEKAEEARQEKLSTGKDLEVILQDKNFASEEDITRAKSQVDGIPFVRLSETGTSPEALGRLDESVARRYRILPFALDLNEKTIKVAMENPMDLQAIDFAEQKSGLRLVVFYAMKSELERTIAERYSQNLSSEVTQALEQAPQVQAHKLQKTNLAELSSGGILRDAPINRIVETILDFAIKARASDIHIEPQESRTRVRYRIDGILQEKLILPSSVHDAVVSRIKILTDLKIDERRVPQDGRFNYATSEQEVDLRVSTLPTIYGEKIVMRLLKKNTTVPSLEDLGLRGLALKNVKEAIEVPHGIILVTGPTGSGKTTTLYSVVNIINRPRVNIMTLEDPVEYKMYGVSQVQVNNQAGLTFASGLRSFLRQDPDVIMVGEIRDSETAELAVQAALTGHLVFSTLHTSSAAGAVPRLLDMGAEPFLLASSLTMAIAQRVVRKINDTFKEEYEPDQAVIDDIKEVLGDHYTSWCKKNKKDPDKLTLFRPQKDIPQTESDYQGRIAIYEVMIISEGVSKLILERKPANEMEKLALTEGTMLMKQDGYLKALDGITTIEEVLRVAEV